MQSLRVVEVLERGGEGLNLTDAVRDGILHHTGPGRPRTLEGQVVRLMDRIAYVNHDIEDALRAGVIADARPARRRGGGRSAPTTSERLTTLVADIVATSAEGDEIRQSPEIGARLPAPAAVHVPERLPGAAGQRRGRPGPAGWCRRCSPGSSTTPSRLPPAPEADLVTRVTDFVAGMTDRYALRVYREIFMPSEGPL